MKIIKDYDRGSTRSFFITWSIVWLNFFVFKIEKADKTLYSLPIQRWQRWESFQLQHPFNILSIDHTQWSLTLIWHWFLALLLLYTLGAILIVLIILRLILQICIVCLVLGDSLHKHSLVYLFGLLAITATAVMSCSLVFLLILWCLRGWLLFRHEWLNLWE